MAATAKIPMHFREQLLREEIRFLQMQIVMILRLGITVLAGASVFLLRDVVQAYAIAGGGPIPKPPLADYLRGTLLLTILATFFFCLHTFKYKRLTHYRSQLANCQISGISDLAARKGVREIFFGLYFLFPICHLLLRASVTVGLR